MSVPAVKEYPKLLAPRQDRQVLISPEPRQLLRQTWENHQALRGNSDVRILGVPLSRLRGWMRRWLGHREDARPIIATGHQTELYHPGVWVKNAAIDAAASRIGAQAIHFAVDTDGPKHLMYRWPGGGVSITDDPELGEARWSGLLKPPSAGHLKHLREAAGQAAAVWDYAPDWQVFFDAVQSGSSHATDLSHVISDAHESADRALGLNGQMLVASIMWKTAGFLLVAYDICSRAEEYAAIYNGALAAFRERNGISSPGRPMPDLSRETDFCEAPFWLDDLADKARKRLSLVREEDAWSLRFGDASFRFERQVKDGWSAAEYLSTWLNQQKLRISPRALTLTGFLRLAVVDQFTHGIGGAIYDQVTDTIFANYYGLTPPAFSVATATLYFPSAASREPTCLECLNREGRKLYHGVLGERKLQLVGEIAAAPRHSTRRAAIFSRMHREMDEARVHDPHIAEFQHRFEAARQEHARDLILFDREFPYTLQSRERLLGMIDHIRGLFA